jgi:hypothetical protein
MRTYYQVVVNYPNGLGMSTQAETIEEARKTITAHDCEGASWDVTRITVEEIATSYKGWPR